jgi:hypothetical protein
VWCEGPDVVGGRVDFEGVAEGGDKGPGGRGGVDEGFVEGGVGVECFVACTKGC